MSEEARQELRRSIRAGAATGGEPVAVLAQVRELLAIGKPADAMLCASALNGIGDALVGTKHLRRLKTCVVRSVTVEPVLPYLRVEAALAGFLLEPEVGGYGSYMDDMLNPDGVLRAGAEFDLALVILDLEDVAGGLADLCADGRGTGVAEEIAGCAERLSSMLRSARGRVGCRMVVQGFVVPDESALGDVGEANLSGGLRNAVRRLNAAVAEVCAGVPDCSFFAVDDVAARFGRAGWRDARLFLSSRLAVAPAAFPAYAQGLVRSIAAMFRPMRKVLCTDLDNTLWGGILGEDGPEGIATGSAFPGNCYLEYQRYLLRLRARGVLLAAVSKNNPEDVEEAFRLRAADLALKLDDFVARKISWDEKADALRELAQELSLGLDSFVFVDDNPVECEAIRQALPGVAVIAAPVTEPWTAVSLLERSGLFDTATVTEDDLQRSDEYRNQARREELLQTLGNRDEFLQSLGIVCSFVPATEAPLARSVQLLAKTNQFNLTTRRHSAVEVERFAGARGGAAVAVRVRDRFGDAGVVGLGLARTAGEVCTIDTVLLSCRVIGRGIETALLAEVAAQAQAAGARWLIGEYRPTKKNSLCAGFYPDHGFISEPLDGAPPHPERSVDEIAAFYWYDLAWGAIQAPAWLTLEGEAHEFATGSAVRTAIRTPVAS